MRVRALVLTFLLTCTLASLAEAKTKKVVTPNNPNYQTAKAASKSHAKAAKANTSKRAKVQRTKTTKSKVTKSAVRKTSKR